MNSYIEEVFFDGHIIGYTDFIKIYLNRNVKGKYLDTLRKHELSHIWLNHHLRTRSYEKLDIEKWNIACDMEIAMHIYTKKDECNIKEPRSPIAGGITTDDCAKYPNCLYAEEYYEELLKNQDSDDGDGGKGNMDFTMEDLQNILGDDVDVKQLIQEAMDKAAEMEAEASIAEQQHKINEIKAPKPSIASEIDALSRERSLRTRVKSYSRPSRRGEEGDLIKKGKKTKIKAAEITVYLDRSGSFNSDKTKQADDKIKDVLRKYRGKIKADVLYFNDKLMIKDPVRGGGGTNYDSVVNHINQSGSLLSIIITDDDGCNKSLKSDKKILIVPVGCTTTQIAKTLHKKEITI